MDKNAKKRLLREQRKREVRRQILILCVIGALGIGSIVALAMNLGHGDKNDADSNVTQRSSEDESSKSKENQEAKNGGDKANAGDEGALSPEEIQSSSEEDKTAPVLPTAPVTLTISAAGDCTLGTDVNFDQSTSFTTKYEAVGDPSYFLENVQGIFASDDLTIVNLEGTLTTGGERADKTFAFRGDPSYTQILTSGSVEAVNLANNHSKDYGKQSYEDTIANVEAAGITSFGYDRTALMEIKGVKVGLVGTYELADGIGCKEGMIQNINSLKEQGAQLIIASFHWGTEKEYHPDEVQRELAHAAIDAGAHLVLGHHPHVLQGIEKYNGRYICYSLGNFCFGGNKNPSDKDTMIFQQTFTVLGDEVVQDDSATVIPCSVSSSSSINNYQPTPAEGSEKERIQQKIDELAIS